MSPPESPAILARGLTKSFGRVTAVADLDLTVPAGARFGFLGPNGSGKTTTVRMLLGLVYATRGSMEVLGEPMPRAARRVLPDVGALVEGPAFPRGLSGRAALRALDAAGPDGDRAGRRDRVEQALARVALDGVDDRPVRAYSLGMRQRLGLAAALLHRPRLLVLDEPTNGLDPQGIAEIRELLTALNADGVTVFLSSHLLAEVEGLCTDVAVVDRGRLIVADTLPALLTPTGRLDLTTDDPAAAAALFGRAVVGVSDHRVTLEGPPAAQVARDCVAAGLEVRELTVRRRTLEDVFVALTGTGSDRRSVHGTTP
ncbi:MAG: transporter related protein [Mycobacterium sp.]|nr:transporter related protein [Mycobacterium sp.]